MLFSSVLFWVFFLCVFFTYWRLRTEGHRVSLLLAASYLFYGAWDWRFLGLISFVIIVAFYCGKKTAQATEIKLKKRILKVAVFCHLSVLCTFKYLDFFLSSFNEFSARLGFDFNDATLGIILPVGVSFYVFQAISYNVDLYRNKIPSTFSLKEVAFYIVFFPQLVAGPIVRASSFFPQIQQHKELTAHVFYSAIKVISLGLCYKIVLADNIAPFVDRVYDNLSNSTDLERVLATLGFHSQIYFDFAGYTFIAIGVARLLGYRIPKNFNYPYLAFNITDFWRRWHISLSSWLRDYLYIPLGGNRKGPVRGYMNLLITMLLGGLWHGAAWTFIIWGGIHGIALCIHKVFIHIFGRNIKKSVMRKIIGFALTQYVVLLAWVFFRAQSFDDVMLVLSSFMSPKNILSIEALLLGGATVFISLPLIVDHVIGRYKHAFYTYRPSTRSSFVMGGFAGLLIVLGVYFIPLETQPFVYFQF